MSEESAVDRVIRLTAVDVRHYDRRDKSGKVEHVSSYVRHDKGSSHGGLSDDQFKQLYRAAFPHADTSGGGS